MCRFVVVLLVATGVVQAAPVPKAKPKPPSLDGWWITSERVHFGQNIKAPWIWELKGEKLTIYTGATGDDLRPTYQNATTTVSAPDPDKPNEIDYKFVDGTTVLVYRGRMEWDGEEWLFCFGEAGAERPAELKAGKGVYFHRFKRMEKK